jgi:DNA-binding transcriptional regulator YhcF (GntR family)
MKTEELLKKLEGIHTLDTIAEMLKVNKRTAQNYLTRLRKQRYVKTTRTQTGMRIYRISRQNKIGGTSYQEILNKYSPMKLAESETYKIHGRTPTPEETLVYAIETKKVRNIIAALALFKNITNWKILGKITEGNKNLKREICALYDVARKIMKTRRMSKKFKNSATPTEEDEYISIIQNAKSKDFNKEQEKWKTYIPLNINDLEDYLTQ